MAGHSVRTSARVSGRVSSRKSAASSSVRGKKKKGKGSDAAWKHSPLVGTVLVIIIILCVLSIISTLTGNGSSLIPSDFPHAYIAVNDNGNYNAIIIKRGKRETKTPFTENGKEYWEAYICHNEDCPARNGGKAAKKKKKKKEVDNTPPYIFAAVRPPEPKTPSEANPEQMEDYYFQITCPACQAAYDKASARRKLLFDLSAVERYQTDEAIKILDKIREEYRERIGTSE